MSKQRILLIHPEETRGRLKFTDIVEDEPLEIEIIQTVLKESGYETYIFDPDRMDKKFIEVLKELNPTIVYINGVVKQVPYIKDYLKNCKKYNPSMTTIVGGIYAEYNYKDFYEEYIDYICRTIDPYVVLEVVELMDKKKKNIENLNGLCYRNSKTKEWIENKITPFDINKLPNVDRKHFYAYKEHFRLLKTHPLAHVRSTYSCAHKCSFCYRSIMNQSRYTEKDIDKFVEEIESIDCDNIYIVDDNFLFNKSRLKKFIDLIRKKKIKKNYICYGRCDFIVKNQEIIKDLKDIGFTHIIVGLEATSDKYLDNYNKKVDMNDNEKCVKILNELGIELYAMMIVDLDFTRKDFINMYKWVKELKIKYAILSIFTPLPGSTIFEQYKDRLITKNLVDFDYTHLVVKPTKMGVRRFMFYYHILLIRLFFLAKKYGCYDFINFKKKIHNILFHGKK